MPALQTKVFLGLGLASIIVVGGLTVSHLFQKPIEAGTPRLHPVYGHWLVGSWSTPCHPKLTILFTPQNKYLVLFGRNQLYEGDWDAVGNNIRATASDADKEAELEFRVQPFNGNKDKMLIKGFFYTFEQYPLTRIPMDGELYRLSHPYADVK